MKKVCLFNILGSVVSENVSQTFNVRLPFSLIAYFIYQLPFLPVRSRSFNEISVKFVFGDRCFRTSAITPLPFSYCQRSTLTCLCESIHDRLRKDCRNFPPQFSLIRSS